MLQKIIIFGGTFDPVHLGHIKMVSSILEQGWGDEVWYLPVFKHQTRFVKKQMSEWSVRLDMLKLVQQPNTKICDFEKTSGQPSYAHFALRKLSQDYPGKQFSWLMGSDQLGSLHYWKCDQDAACFPEAADEYSYFVYPRKGHPMDLPYNNLQPIQDVEPMSISSTEIRHKIKQQESISELVAPEVEEYIRQHQLYRE
jgi:nicotinate-nucleotide adenylyltransferase